MEFSMNTNYIFIIPLEEAIVGVQSLSRTRLSVTPVDCSTPGFPVLHHLPEFAQTHVHRVGDAIQPSHPLSSPCPPAFNLPQHQGLFQWVSFSHQVNKGYWSFSFSISPSSEYPGWISFKDWLVWSPCSPRDSQKSSPAPYEGVLKHLKNESP